jgi:hypothetical protein
MSRFLSETYDKPKLIEQKLIKKIINNQNNEITFETKIKDTLIDIIKNYYKIILPILFIFGCLYWRYIEIQKKRKQIYNLYNEDYEEDSENITSDEN